MRWIVDSSSNTENHLAPLAFRLAFMKQQSHSSIQNEKTKNDETITMSQSIQQTPNIDSMNETTNPQRRVEAAMHPIRCAAIHPASCRQRSFPMTSLPSKRRRKQKQQKRSRRCIHPIAPSSSSFRCCYLPSMLSIRSCRRRRMQSDCRPFQTNGSPSIRSKRNRSIRHSVCCCISILSLLPFSLSD